VTLAVAVREPSRADALLEAIDGLGTRVTVVALEEADRTEPDLLVNATPLGVHGEELPLPTLGPGVTVIDLLYRPAETPLVRSARAAGAAAFGGLGLLLHQAALSFELWTGRLAPLPVMSAAAIGALGDRGPSTEDQGRTAG
jgi:shikimate 5-dehydrogenase